MDFKKIYEDVSCQFQNRPMLVWFDNKEKKSFSKSEFYTLTDKVSAKLEKSFADIPKGHWIGFKCRNHAYWYPIFFGLLQIGYPVLLLDPAVNETALISFAEQSAMKGIVSDKEEDIKGITCCTISELVNADENIPVNICWESRIAFCTSGTTGNAKIYVFHTEEVSEQMENLKNAFSMIPEISDTFSEKESHSFLQCLPQRHCLGFGFSMIVWCFGYPMIMPEQEGIFSVADTCRKYNVWGLCTVPAIWNGLFQMAKARFGDTTESSMRKLLGEKIGLSVSAGARMSETLHELAKNSGISFWNGWGMTETSFVTVGNISDDESTDYVGVLVNKHRTDFADVNEKYKELIVNGSTVYHSLLEHGSEIIRDKEEYYHTGDLFEEKDGHYYFKGRCKSVLIREDGENIYLEELEMMFGFLEMYSQQYCVCEGKNIPVLVISSKNGISEEIFSRICSVNAEMPQSRRIGRVYVTKNILPLTSKGEVARYHMNAYLTQNRDDFEELQLQ